MIKQSDNGGLWSGVDSVIQKFLIKDTTLRSFIPPQVRKMNPRLRQICGCEICTITKAVQIDLNRFNTKRVSYLQQKYIGIHTYNNAYSTTIAAHYKEKVFPGG